jgi:WD40 repeat protein
MSDSQSVPNVEDDSFATIIIIAHGQDLRSRRATLEQQETLRKFTLAGKSGHEVCVPNAVVDNMFYMAHQLARLEHVPFTEKLKYMRTESKRQQFDKIFQNLWVKEKTKTAAAAAAAAEAAKFKSLVPTVDDWLSTTNVSYDHFYQFAAHDPADPWEIDKFGIWLVDGSPQVLQGFKDVPIPLDSLRYYNIMDRIGFPQWHAAGTVTATTLFDVAEMTKRTFHVKYVNIVDMSCRVVYQSEALDVQDDPISEIKPSASHQPDIQIGDIRIKRMSKQPPDLPAGWVFGKNLTTGEYVFANPDSGEISPESPEADSGAISPADICVATLEGHTGSVNSVAFNSTGILATGSSDGTAKLWNTTGCVATLTGHREAVASVAFHPLHSTGRLLATGSWDKTAKVWGLQPVADGLSAICGATLEGHTDYVTSVAFNSTRFLATGSWDTTAKVWGLQPVADGLSAICVATLTGHTDAVNSVAFHPTAALILATGSSDNTAKLWDSSGNCTTTLKGHTGSVTSVAFHSTGRLIATGSDDKTAKLWDSSGTCVGTLEGHTGSVNSVAFHSTGFLATGSADRTVKLWNTKGCMATLEGNTDSVLSVAFNQTQSGKLLATGSGDNAKLWNLLLLNKIKHPKMFGMPQTLPQGWIYVKGNVPFQTYYGNEHDTKYDTYYVGPKGEINPHGPYKYTAGSKKSSKQNKKKTKRSSKQNKKKTKKTKVLK